MSDKTSEVPYVCSCFLDYEKPEEAIQVKVHILCDSKYSYLEDFLVQEIPDCYITKTDLSAQVNKTGLSASEILQSKIPDPGNVMSGEFGEILTLFYLGDAQKEGVRKIKKWRFKEDRNRAVLKSDVVILYRQNEGKPSKNDFVICAETKAKATDSSRYDPIKNALEGYEEDKTGRLARTLVWLKDKAIAHESADSIAFIRRFTDKLLDVEFKKNYKAVAIIDRNFLDAELLKTLDIPPQGDEFEVVVLGITDLRGLYERSYSRAVAEISND